MLFGDIPGGHREDIIEDWIMYSIDDVPVFARIGRNDDVTNTFHEWRIDRRRDRGANRQLDGFRTADLRPVAVIDQETASNTTQIMTAAVEESTTKQILSQKGGIVSTRDIFARNSLKALQALTTDVNFECMNGVRTGAAVQPRGMAGLMDQAAWVVPFAAIPQFQLNVVTAVAGTGITRDAIVLSQQAAYNDGRKPDIFFVSSDGKLDIANLTQNIRRVNPESTNRRFAEGIDYFESDFGVIEIVMERNIPADTGGFEQAFMMSSETVDIAYVHSAMWVRSGIDGDSAIGWWRLECTLEMREPYANVIIENISR